MSSFEFSSTLGEIAYRQINALPAKQQLEVFEFIGKLYQAQLEGDDQRSVAILFRHNPQNNEVSYLLKCHLAKAFDLLTEAQKVVDSLSDIYLDKPPLEDLWQPCDDDDDDEASQQLDESIESTEAAREKATDAQD